MTRIALSLLGAAALAIMVGSGCATTKPIDYTPTQARLFLESGDANAPTVKLPRSGVVIAVSSKAVITEGDIINAEVVQVELGRCLLLQVTPTAARDLYRLTGANQGRRLVLTLNDVALGARQIDRPFDEGAVMIFVELSDAELATLAVDLKRTSAELQKAIKRSS
jgi:preprotein translocase subunit SecD